MIGGQLRLVAVCVALFIFNHTFADEQVATNSRPIPAIEQQFDRDQAAGQPMPDFQRHVVPLLGKLGCNGRACHGSFQGRGGMTLSLFGYDFNADHAALTGKSEAEQTNRVNRSSPDDSLILLKATSQIDHGGERRIEQGTWQYRLLRRWIADGAIKDEHERMLSGLTVRPSELTWTGPDQTSAIQVVANWSDGVQEDVTALTRFRSNDDAVARVDTQGIVTSIAAGDTHIIAFYDNGIVAVPVVVASQTEDNIQWPDEPSPSPIDKIVNGRLRTLGLVPSALCDDGEFLRRASIDLTGTLPTPAEVKQFLADSSKDKRRRKIDELLQRPAMAAWWATKLCDFTGCNPQQQAELGQDLAEQWYMWIYSRLRENVPYDQIVEGILLAKGRRDGESFPDYATRTSSYFRQGSVSDFTERSTMPHFWSRRTLVEPKAKALAVAHAFLGIRLQCAECHKHPWDRWTQDDFQQFSRFFSDVRFGVAPQSRKQYDQMAKRVGLSYRKGQEGGPIRIEQLERARKGESIPWREVYLQARDQPIELSLLGAREVGLNPDDDPRQALMDWLREPNNPWFSRSIVNRIWSSCFHIGIVHPTDDLNPANPPSNPELLDWLSSEFVKHDYDLRWLLREIANSNTWQRSCIANANNQSDRRHFSHAIPRRLPAEVVYDGIKQVLCGRDQQTNVRTDLSRRAVGHLSMRMAGTYAMHVFGKPERAVTCDCERVNDPSLLQSVFMQNDPLIHLMIDDSPWLAECRDDKSTAEESLRRWIEEAWLRCYARLPGESEIGRALSHLRTASTIDEGREDLMWSLLNTKEFLLNH